MSSQSVSQTENRRTPFLETLGRDVRYAMRTLLRDAGFRTFAVLIVGLGVGVSCTIFSVVNTLLIRPPPFRDPGRLVWIAKHQDDTNDMSGKTSQTDYLLDRRAKNQSYEDLAAYYAFYGLGDAKLIGDGQQERLTSVPVTQNFFPTLGVAPQLGRQFSAEECKQNGPRVTMLSDGLWRRKFGADPNVLGRAPSFDAGPVTVVGVLPASFDFSTVFTPGSRIDMFEPLPLSPEINRQGDTAAIIGRLKPGVSVESARAETAVLGKLLKQEHKERNDFAPKVSGLAAHVSGRLRPTLVVLAFVETRALGHLTSVSIPLLSDVRVDGSALGFTLVAALVTGLLFGLVPALQVQDLNLHDTLKDSNRESSQGRGHAWIRGALVVSELGLACVLLVGAGLLIRSFLRVLDVNMGFRPERTAALRIDPNSSYKTQEQKNSYYTEALHLVLDVRGIEAAGLLDSLPLGHNRSWGIAAKGLQYMPQNYPEGFPRIISDGYFHAMGIPLKAGRDFTERDNKGSLPVIMLNETWVRSLWQGEDPVGEIVQTDGPERTVVGIAGDVHHLALEEASGNEFYIPMRQTQDYRTVDLVVRTSLSPAALASSLREALWPIEPDLPTSNLRTLQAIVDRAVSLRRFVAWLLGGFAGFALVLASLGIYAVIPYSVSQRTQEIGIRMALGASAEMLQRNILLQTLGLARMGMVVGVVASWVLAQSLSGLLFGVSSGDPVTFAGMLVILTAVAAIAGYLPARRASRIDPMSALRTS